MPRKDSKGRNLRKGESQRKDGRYVYRYKDRDGSVRVLYSWRLDVKDKAPAGKEEPLSLREKIANLNSKIEDGIAVHRKMTVRELVESYLDQKTGVRQNTRANYKFVLNIVKKERFGLLEIDEVKISDAKAWLIKLQRDGRGYSTIHSVRGVVRPAFQMAMDDDLIRKNPFQFQLSTVVVNDSATRDALSRKQERQFLDFVKADAHFSRYYDGIYILFKTGLRISEFVGLTIGDIDLKNGYLNVERQLLRTRDMRYMIEQPKTKAGNRRLPLSKDVMSCFERIIRNRPKPKVEPMVDGKIGFLYLDKNGMPMVALHWEKYFEHICGKYNSIYRVPMPNVTPHVCRHTYCSNMAKRGMNPKTLQYLMGHSDICVTLNTYTHLGFEDIEEEWEKIIGKG